MSPSGVFSVRCTSRDVYLYMVLKLLNDNCNEMKSAETGIFGIVCGIREYLCLLIHVFYYFSSKILVKPLRRYS